MRRIQTVIPFVLQTAHQTRNVSCTTRPCRATGAVCAQGRRSMTETERLGRPLWWELLTTTVKAAEGCYTAVVGWAVTPFDATATHHVLHRAGGGGVGG